jgi:hypothetical protein
VTAGERFCSRVRQIFSDKNNFLVLEPMKPVSDRSIQEKNCVANINLGSSRAISDFQHECPDCLPDYVQSSQRQLPHVYIGN